MQHLPQLGMLAKDVFKLFRVAKDSLSTLFSTEPDADAFDILIAGMFLLGSCSRLFSHFRAPTVVQ